MWIIVGDVNYIDLGLQEMIDAMPKEGGTLHISKGTYKLSKPLRLPDSGNVSIVGCTFIGDAVKPETVIPGEIVYSGEVREVYWTGSKWANSIKEAVNFSTELIAVNAAFELVVKNPKWVAAVSVRMVP